MGGPSEPRRPAHLTPHRRRQSWPWPAMGARFAISYSRRHGAHLPRSRWSVACCTRASRARSPTEVAAAPRPPGARRRSPRRKEAVVIIKQPSLDLVHRLSFEPNPALMAHARQRAESAQNRIADRITQFAGSMAFIYIHIIWFGSWIALGVEKYPYGLLTMIVSLEAIFLSTFVMISQNRADAKRQVVADLQWQTVQEEDKQTSSCSISRTR